MNILKAILLGLIQGVSEFFPISSSGNLYFYSSLFNIKAYTVSFDILVHAASLLALIFVYFNDMVHMVKNPSARINKLVGMGILPIFIVSVLFQRKIDSFFLNSKALGLCFIFSGAVLFYETMYNPGKKRFKNMNIKDSALIGVFQAVGVIPAVSRTGMAICGGLQRGFDGRTSLKYAYIMAVPAMLGRIAGDMVKLYMDTNNTVTDVFGSASMMLAFVTAFVASVLSIRVMQRIAARGNFRCFSYYMWLIGLITLIDMLAVNKIF